ncbi:MAG: phage holin family protein [Myxococcota bacterium]
MRGFIIRMAVGALGLWLASRYVTGLKIDGNQTLLAAALLLGVANAVVRPIVVFLTFPITVVTLGLFLLAVNAGMLAGVAWLLDGFSVEGFVAALLGALIVSLTSWVASWTIGPQGKFELLMSGRRR